MEQAELFRATARRECAQNSAVNGSKVLNDSLTGTDINESTLAKALGRLADSATNATNATNPVSVDPSPAHPDSEDEAGQLLDAYINGA